MDPDDEQRFHSKYVISSNFQHNESRRLNSMLSTVETSNLRNFSLLCKLFDIPIYPQILQISQNMRRREKTWQITNVHEAPQLTYNRNVRENTHMLSYSRSSVTWFKNSNENMCKHTCHVKKGQLSQKLCTTIKIKN